MNGLFSTHNKQTDEKQPEFRMFYHVAWHIPLQFLVRLASLGRTHRLQSISLLALLCSPYSLQVFQYNKLALRKRNIPPLLC